MTRPPGSNKTYELTLAEAETINRLRLLIARAAQTDSLRWWDDRSLTTEGGFMTERLFPIRPRLAGAKIAMATARVRHWAAIPKEKGVLHLFDFGEELEAELATAPLDEAWVPVEPFASTDAFGDALRQAVPDGIGYTVVAPIDVARISMIEVINEIGLKPVVAQASALALVYETAEPDRPVFPYLHS